MVIKARQVEMVGCVEHRVDWVREIREFRDLLVDVNIINAKPLSECAEGDTQNLTLRRVHAMNNDVWRCRIHGQRLTRTCTHKRTSIRQFNIYSLIYCSYDIHNT